MKIITQHTCLQEGSTGSNTEPANFISLLKVKIKRCRCARVQNKRHTQNNRGSSYMPDWSQTDKPR